LTGSFTIALPTEQAFVMFTPTGERIWAHGWDPIFPSPSADETEPGTVFRTVHADQESTWTVVRCEAGRSIVYAVAIPAKRCGLVGVACEPSEEGTRVTVTYDLTALNGESNAELDVFAANYEPFLSDWERSIAAVIEGKNNGRPHSFG